MTHTAKHTPGPWFVSAGRVISTPSGEFYLTYGENKAGEPLFKSFVELDRNAHLIAAAPAMYEALKMAGWLSNECDCHESWNAPEGNLCGHCTADLAIKTALAQAEGRQA